MRRVAGARGPQMQAGFAARAMKLDITGFNGTACQQLVAAPATNFRGIGYGRFHTVFIPSLRGNGVKCFRFIYFLLVVEPVDLDDAGYPPFVVLCFFHVHGQIYSPPDELLLGTEPGFFHQFFQAWQSFFSAVRMKGADAARMPGVPESRTSPTRMRLGA